MTFFSEERFSKLQKYLEFVCLYDLDMDHNLLVHFMSPIYFLGGIGSIFHVGSILHVHALLLRTVHIGSTLDAHDFSGPPSDPPKNKKEKKIRDRSQTLVRGA